MQQGPLKEVSEGTRFDAFSPFYGAKNPWALRAHIKMRNGRVAGDLGLLQGARRKNILYGSSTDEQRRSSAKDRQPGGLFSGGHLAALLLSHRALRLSSFVAPCQPPARKQRAHSSFRYGLLAILEFNKSLTGHACHIS